MLCRHGALTLSFAKLAIMSTDHLLVGSALKRISCSLFDVGGVCRLTTESAAWSVSRFSNMKALQYLSKAA